MSSETEREALKPCPFCGSGADRIGPRHLAKHITIQCGDCEANGPWVPGMRVEAAEAAWQSRAAQAAEAPTGEIDFPPLQSRSLDRRTEAHCDLDGGSSRRGGRGAACRLQGATMKLPQGWSEDDGHLSHLLVLKHERMGWMSIDLEKRIFSPGMGQPRIWRPTTTYSGRGWKDRIVADAIAYAESVFGGSAAQKHDPGTPAPLTPEGETT